MKWTTLILPYGWLERMTIYWKLIAEVKVNEAKKLLQEEEAYEC